MLDNVLQCRVLKMIQNMIGLLLLHKFPASPADQFRAKLSTSVCFSSLSPLTSAHRWRPSSSSSTDRSERRLLLRYLFVPEDQKNEFLGVSALNLPFMKLDLFSSRRLDEDNPMVACLVGLSSSQSEARLCCFSSSADCQHTRCIYTPPD